MVKVSPFKGLTYNPKKINKLDDVMSPPYDIISEDMQSELYKKHPENFVRLILGKINSDDSEENNRYSRAKILFNKWIDESLLISSDKPAIYPYKIQYKVKNQLKIMNGFFVLLKIDPDYKYVKAHERTLSKPKADRLNLMRACQANLEPIQLLYIDEKDKIGSIIDGSINEPFINVKGYDGFTHKIWRMDSNNSISKIQKELNDKILFIADGHHRYQTAINYANELKEKTGNTDENAPFNYRMVILVNIFDKGLSILPTHRLIKKDGINIDEILQKLKGFFEIKEILIYKENVKSICKRIKDDLETKDEHKFALYSKGKYYLLTLKNESFMDKFSKDHSKTWRTLDVSILHMIILDNIMGINQENLEDHVRYTRADEEAIKFVDQGKFDLSFLMNATKIEELKAIAEAGEHMPQKSTYFLPKMLSGLVMYKM
ncbi:hypothetical protein AYK24_08075 [Thermoplasmatales archaeon SG8-52-4]|nr:MAG: hypothetical protein AYK24_08075 [Thermoplasmatales archaeon SG8-52-4]